MPTSDQLLQNASAMLRQTKAQGNTPFAGSSYDPNAVKKTDVGTGGQTGRMDYSTSPNGTYIPTPVVSSAQGAQHFDTISNTVTDANQSIADGNKAKAEAAAKVPAPVTPTKTTTTLEQDILNEGQHEIFNSTTGQKNKIGINDPIPAGWTNTNPTTGPISPVTNTAETPGGTTYKQFADGTYGRFDINGNYAGKASADDFNGAVTQKKNGDAMQSIIDGTYPLNDSEKAQISALQNVWNKAIEQQKTDNANLVGGTTVAQNLYGIGNTQMAQGHISDIISKGTEKIASMNTQMLAAVAQMTQSLKDKDYDRLKTVYDSYNATQKERTATIKSMADEATAVMKDQQTKRETAINAVDNDIRTAMENAKKGQATNTQLDVMGKALQNHDYNAALDAAGDSLVNATGWMGEYYAYKKEAQSRGVAPMTPVQFKNWDDNNKANLAYASTPDARQDKYEQQYRNILLKPLSNRSGGLGLEDMKVNQAIHLKAIFDQNLDPKTGNYNIPLTLYNEIALGLARLVSPTGVVGSEVQQSVTQSTARGDLGNALTYIGFSPTNGTTQDVLKIMKDSIDRQATVAEQNRDTYMQYLHGLAPTGLDQSRRDSLEKNLLNTYTHPLIKEAQDTVTKINNFVNISKENNNSYNSLKTKYPNATPDQISQALGIK